MYWAAAQDLMISKYHVHDLSLKMKFEDDKLAGGVRQRANGYVLMGPRILGIQAQNGPEWLGEWLRRLFGGS